jgi:DNA helicase-2/ATP-dependent DNA helicase PcrA
MRARRWWAMYVYWWARQVLVDEFQDTSAVQFEFIHMLAAQHRSLFVVGDPNQSIYAWRGARVANMLDTFERQFDSAYQLNLQRNYRSTRGIQVHALPPPCLHSCS